MNKVKDFIIMNVFDLNGRKIGEVKDIAINYYESKVIGFQISTRGFSKKNFIRKENIVSISDSIIVDKVFKNQGLIFNDIKDMEIINKEGVLIGIVEDLLIDIKNFTIRGLLVSTGFFDKFIKGRIVILLSETILGDGHILFLGNSKVQLTTIPQRGVFSD